MFFRSFQGPGRFMILFELKLKGMFSICMEVFNHSTIAPNVFLNNTRHVQVSFVSAGNTWLRFEIVFSCYFGIPIPYEKVAPWLLWISVETFAPHFAGPALAHSGRLPGPGWPSVMRPAGRRENFRVTARWLQPYSLRRSSHLVSG